VVGAPLLLAALLVLVAPGGAGATPRPTDDRPGAYQLPPYSTSEEPPHCVERVCVHWVATTRDAPPDLSDADGSGTPDGVEAIAAGAANALRRLTAVPPAGLGWRMPEGDGARGGGQDLVDVYLQDLRGTAYGIAPRDDGQEQGDWTPSGFVLVDRAYATRGYAPSVSRHLMPHELGHLVEYAYDGWFESWHAEATSQWLAAAGVGGLQNLAGDHQAWSLSTAFPLLGRGEGGNLPPKSYSASTWLHWLALRHGPGAVRALWERAAEHAPWSFHPRSVDAALGTGTFFDELVAFSVAQAEWRTPASGFRGVPTSAFGDVQRAGTLGVGGAPGDMTLDHTTSAYFDVPVPADAAPLALRVRAPAGTRSALALVGRTGGPEDGQVEIATVPLPEGGEGTVSLPSPGRFARITAVVVNADAALASDRKDDTGQWTYARDDQAYSASVAAVTEPPAPTPAPGAAPGPVVTQDAPSRDGPAGPPPRVDDVLAPVVRLLGFDARRRRVTLRLGEPARVTAALVVDRATARRLRLRSRSVTRRTAMLASGRRTVTLPRVRGALRGRRATLRIVAADAAGNVRRLSRRVVLR